MTSGFLRGRRATAAMGIVAAVALLLPFGSVVRAGQDESAADARRALAIENARLEALVELAKTPDFYLVLDAKAGALRLMLKGAELRAFPVLEVHVGSPRIGFLRRAAAGPWQGVVWTGGELDPPREIERVELAVPPPDTEEAPAATVPPTPEEAFPAPLRFHLSFPGGPAIEVRPLDADDDAGLLSRFAAAWVSYWGDLWAALTTPPEERVRLRLTLSPDEAGMLYRSLPPNVSLFVL